MNELTHIIKVLRVTRPDFFGADDSKKAFLRRVVVQDGWRRALENFLNVCHDRPRYKPSWVKAMRPGASSLRFLQEPALSLSKGWAAILPHS